MIEVKEVISPAEERIDRTRRTLGLLLGPVLFGVLWCLPTPGLADPAHRLLAVIGLVVTFWVTEAIPLPATALMGPALCVALGIAAPREAFRGFGDPIILLFLGSFLLAQAMLHHGLNRRIAFVILGLPWVAQGPGRLLLAFAVITGFTSMWVSNTATTAMMCPIALAILTELARRQGEREGRDVAVSTLGFSTGLMLTAAFASSLGGMATPVGTPTNLVGLGLIERTLQVKITFFQWMLMGLPLAVILIGVLVVYFWRVCPVDAGLLAGSAGWLKDQKERLGVWSHGERNVVLAFSVTVVLWVAPGVCAVFLGRDHATTRILETRIPESVAALAGALLLFVLPVNWSRREFTLAWRQAQQVDWGTILLFGGGLALGDLMFSTGLAKWMGEGVASALAARTLLGLVILFSVAAMVLSETTSNTASATMVVPVAIAVAQAAGVNPLPPALAATFAASLGFMLPVSTPPNAIVYGTGAVSLVKMARHGVVLDLASLVAVILLSVWVVPRLFPMG